MVAVRLLLQALDVEVLNGAVNRLARAPEERPALLL